MIKKSIIIANILFSGINLQSADLKGVIFANNEALGVSHGGTKPDIDALQDGVGVVIGGMVNSPVNFKKYNEAVFKYGEDAKSAGITLKDELGTEGFNDIKEKFYKELPDNNNELGSQNHSPTVSLINSESIVLEDSTKTFTIQGNDIDGDALTYSIENPPSHGTATISGNALTYTPEANYNGIDTLSITSNDGTTSSMPYTINLTVSPVNDAPSINPFTEGLSMYENTTKTFTIQGNDIDGDPLTYQITTQPMSGTATISGNVLTYTPISDYIGPDSLNIISNDGTTSSMPYTINITIEAPNTPPVADSDTISMDEDTTQNILLTAFDIESAIASYEITQAPSHGTAIISGDTITYTPNLDYFGTDIIKFKVKDEDGAYSDEATITININDVDDTPVLIPQYKSIDTQENAPKTITLEPLDAGLEYIITQNSSLGETVINNNILTFTPYKNFSGMDELRIKIKDINRNLVSNQEDSMVVGVEDSPFKNVIVNKCGTPEQQYINNWDKNTGVYNGDILCDSGTLNDDDLNTFIDLKRVHELSLEWNSISSLAGLANLETVDYRLSLAYNFLTSLNGLEKLRTVGTYFDAQGQTINSIQAIKDLSNINQFRLDVPFANKLPNTTTFCTNVRYVRDIDNNLVSKNEICQ